MSVAEPLLNLIRNISGNTRVVGLIGWPVEHSLSPAMHNAAFKKLGLDYVYVPFRVKPGTFKAALSGLRALGVIGVNVTIPYKKYAKSLIDKCEQDAKMIDAVNTITIKDKLYGYNTDVYGFRMALMKAGFNAKGKRTVLMGAGGAARAIGHELFRCGAKSLCIINPTRKLELLRLNINDKRIIKRAVKTTNELTRVIKKNFKSRCAIKTLKPESKEANQEISETELLVNATSLGMFKNDPLPVVKSALHKGLFVFDVVYNRETELLKCARKIGAKAMGGLEMLVYQGAKAFELWTKPAVPVEDIAKIMRKAALAELKKHAQ